MSPRVAHIRRLICRNCPHPCDGYRQGLIDHDNPAASCPVPWHAQWHVDYGDGGAPMPQRVVPMWDAAAQGRAAWLWLHTEAAADRLTEAALRDVFAPMIPRYCSCAKNWKVDLAAHPLPATGQLAWSVDRHNSVNTKLGKPLFLLSQALQRWTSSQPK